jgi:hypothetical protein
MIHDTFGSLREAVRDDARLLMSLIAKLSYLLDGTLHYIR